MKPRRTGFTLIEVLIVLAIAGMILVMLSQGLRIGIQAVQGYFRAVQPQADMEPVERVLRGMIDKMDPGLYPEPPLIKGTSHAAIFTTELPDPATGGTLTADVRVDAEHGELVLWWTPHTNGIPFGAPPSPERKVLLDRVERVDFAYSGSGTGTAWASGWTLPVLPKLVRIRIVPSDGGDAWPPIIARSPREQAEG